MGKSLCVIPARSGSKGLKDKNILELCGKPVLTYTIAACIQSEIFEDVYVATDSEKYAEIAIKYGAQVPFLEPSELAQDNIPSLDPVLYFYDKLGKDYDYIWCMQPTSPLRSSKDIIDAYNIICKDKDCEFVLGTTIIDPHYFHWALKDQANGRAELYFGREVLVDRSELSDIVYRPNGAIKVGRTRSILRERNFFGNNIRRIEMPEERSIHIRSQYDFDLCSFLMEQKGQK